MTEGMTELFFFVMSGLSALSMVAAARGSAVVMAAGSAGVVVLIFTHYAFV